MSDVRKRTVKVTLPMGTVYTLEDFEPWGRSCGLEQEDFVAAGPLRANNVWHFTMASEWAVNKVLEQPSIRVAGKEGQLSAIDESFVHLKIHWLPYFIEDGVIIGVLEKYGKVTSFQYGRPAGRNDGSFFQDVQGLTRYIVLRTRCPMERLPYTLKLSNEEEEYCGLISIRGRAPKCFKCGTIGHERRDCESSYCATCKAYHKENRPNEICKGPTYARMTMERGQLVKQIQSMDRREREDGKDGRQATGGVETTGKDGEKEVEKETVIGEKEEETIEKEVAESDGEKGKNEEGEQEDEEEEEREEEEEEEEEEIGEGEEGEEEEEEIEEGEKGGEDKNGEGEVDETRENEDMEVNENEEMPLGSSLPCHNPSVARVVETESGGQAKRRLVDFVKHIDFEPAYDPMLDTSLESQSSSAVSPPSSPPRKQQKS